MVSFLVPVLGTKAGPVLGTGKVDFLGSRCAQEAMPAACHSARMRRNLVILSVTRSMFLQGLARGFLAGGGGWL